jgi:hypothetical protein
MIDHVAERLPAQKPKRKLGSRDGLFQRNGWWWIDYADADGKRHRRKAAPDYQTARMVYRDTVAKTEAKYWAFVKRVSVSASLWTESIGPRSRRLSRPNGRHGVASY